MSDYPRSFAARDFLMSFADPRTLVEDVEPWTSDPAQFDRDAARMTDCNGDVWHVAAQRVTGHDEWPPTAS